MFLRRRRLRAARFVATTGLLLGAGYWIVAAAIRPVNSPAQGATLQLPNYPLHLGDGKPGETLRGYFDLFNAGDEPLEFTVIAGCNCSELQPRSGEIPPGESQRIGIGIKLANVSGTSKSVQVTITSNDESQPAAAYLVTADCPMPFQVSPKLVQLGHIVEGTRHTRTVTIRKAEHVGAPSLDGLKWTLDGEGLSVGAKTIEDEQIVLEIVIPADAPRSMLTGTLTLTAETGDQFHVPVNGYVVGPIMTAPIVVHLGTGGEVKWRNFCA